MDPSERERDVDQWLESALSHYGKAEARTGLESRILANLQAERSRIATRRRWWWAAGTATALAAILAVVWVGGRGRESNPPSTAGASMATGREAARGSIQPRPAPQVPHPASEVAQRRTANRLVRDLAVVRPPKLAQFPSPQPLSEQEKILVSYVTKYPKHAALVAQARTEALRRDREEEIRNPISGSNEGSQQRVQ
jgi:hypothetical protein